jgi:tetraacyldisaccharide 4'-kinase
MEAHFRELAGGSSRGVVSTALRAALTGASLPYRVVIAVRNRLYDMGTLPITCVSTPVISIGNITLGGTGKTPLVEYVCRWLLDRGKRPVILSRGYGTAAGRNDEAMLLEANLPDVPHLQGPDRVALASRAIAECRPDVLVLDDGFQHRRLGRDLDVVLIDCMNPFGYGHLLPRGLLREPVAALRRADVVVLTRSNQCSEETRVEIRRTIRAAAGEKPVVLAEHRPVSVWSRDGSSDPLVAVRDRSVAAFCGIGNPAAFWETLRHARANVVGTRAFPDHHRYSASDLAVLGSWVSNLKPDIVLTTQKDLVKIGVTQIADRPLRALRIEVAISEEAELLDRSLASVLGDRDELAHAA